MRQFFMLGAALSVSLLAFHCGSDPASCDETRTCPGDDSGRVDGGGDGDVVVPEGCVLTSEPKDAPKCVANEVGVFVDGATGADANAGTKESPVKTIGGALAKLGGKSRVYVCEGTYAEHVKLTSAVSVYGGFACGGWSYSGNKAKVAPGDAGYALEVSKVSGALAIADVTFRSVAGSDAAPSSIAAFVNATPTLTLRRVDLAAGEGFHGKDASKAATLALMTSMPTAGTLNGNGGDATVGGAAQLCTCVGGGTSKGGGGGNVNGDGSAGATVQVTAEPVGATGLGSTFAECGGGQGGRPGSNAPPVAGAAGAAKLGALAESGWNPEGGKSGTAGTPGQGGGGGGGAAGGGGGGACGGCGGDGGKGGGGGGASVALIALDSPVALVGSTLTSADAGAGGAGGDGGDGAAGGTKGARGGAACDGGNGGKGGNGGAGGGGAGGVSAGVLSKGAKPILDATKITTGAKGAAGTGPAGNSGIEGQKADTLEAPTQ